MKNMVETTVGANLATRVLFALCAFVLAIMLLPAGSAHAASYSIPSNAQGSGTCGGCTWYVTSASASANPGQLVIYPTNGTSGTLADIKESTSPWIDSTAIQSIYVADGVKTSSTFKSAFRDCTSLKTADVANLDTAAATALSGVFYGCTSLESIEGLDTWNVSKATTLASFFYGCESLKSVDLSSWNCAAVTTIYEMFEESTGIESIILPSKGMPKLENAASAFRHCESLRSIDVSGLANSSLSSVYYLFSGCYELEEAIGYEKLVTDKVKDISYFFASCRELDGIDVSDWDVSNVTDFAAVFSQCWTLTSIEGLDKWDTSNGIEFTNMFTSCWELPSLTLGPNFNTSKGTDFKGMFLENRKLEVLDISMLDTTSAIGMGSFFGDMPNLRQVTLGSKFSFTGNGSTSCVLPTPNPAYIPGATGNWQAVGSGTVSAPAGKVYAPSAVPSKVAETYVMEVAKTPVLAANSSWYSGTTAKNSIVTINIVDSYTPTGSEKESWDASDEQDGSVTAYVGADGKTLTIAGNGSGYIKANADSSQVFDEFSSVAAINGLSLLDTSGALEMFGFFADNTCLASVQGIENWDVSSCTTFAAFFSKCTSLTDVDLSRWDMASAETIGDFFFNCVNLVDLKTPEKKAGNLVDAYHAFEACEKLESVNVVFMCSGKLEYIDCLFQNCYSLKDIVGYETLVTASTDSMRAVFNCCRSLEYLNLSKWVTDNADSFGLLFGYTYSLLTIDGLENWDAGNVESMDSTFISCRVTDLSGIYSWDVSSVESFDETFSGAVNLTSLDLSSWSTDAAKDMGGMFDYCPKLATLKLGPGFKTGNVTDFNAFLNNCSSLKVVDLSMLDTRAAADMTDFFTKMKVLQQVTLGENFIFTGKGSTSCVLPTPNPTYIPGATGKWQAVGVGTVSDPKGAVYAPADVPSNVAETYVMEAPKEPILAASNTWYKGSADKGSYAAIHIVDSYAPTGSEKESWDASAKQDGSVMAYVSSDGKSITIAGNGSGYIMANKDSSFAFDGYASVTAITGTEILKTSNTTRMDCMFSDCEALESLNLDNWDVSNVYMFNLFAQNCYSLTSFGPNSLRDWNTGAAEQFSNAFDNCQSLAALDVGKWDVSSCEVFNFMFSDCKSLKTLDVSTWNPSSAVKMACIFQRCESLTTLDFANWNTPLLADASGFLYGCTFTAIDVAGLDLGLCTDIAEFFYSCKNLKTISGLDSWDTSSVKLAFDVFANCESLIYLDLSNWATPNMTSCGSMFSGCESLKILDISGFDTSASSVSNMFKNCYRLQQITLGPKFSFTGNGTTFCVLPTPDPAYISGAIGKWQAVGAGTVERPAGAIYLPADVPSNVAETYVMPLTTISVDVPVKVVLAARSDGTWYTPSAAGNKIVNHSLAPVKVVSAKSSAADGFTMLTAANVAGSGKSNVFGGTITAGVGEAQDLTAIDTSAAVWTMAAETDANDSDLIGLQLAGSIANVEGKYFTNGLKLFDVAYTFELAL